MSDPFGSPAGPPTEPVLPPPPETGGAVASLWARLGGFGLELVLVPCTFVFGWVGWWIIAWADGQTPAKSLLHQHVVNARDGTLVSFGRMALREAVGKGIGAVLVLAGAYFAVPVAVGAGVLYGVVGALPAAIDPRRRALWDRLAGTVVVEGDPPPPPTVVSLPPVDDVVTIGPEGPGTSPA